MFEPNANYVLEVTVEGMSYTEQFINKFYFRFSDPDSGPTGGSSTTFLSNFATLYQTELLPEMYAAYSVNRYWLREIIDVSEKSPGPPPVYQRVYLDSALDYKEGTGLDVGGKALAMDTSYLPAGTAARVLKTPTVRRIKYFNKSYNRFGPFTTAELVNTVDGHDQWSTTFITDMSAAMTSFLGTAVLDQVAGNGWYHALWSDQFYGIKAKPFVISTGQSAALTTVGKLQKYIGTQATRRFNPTGGFRGK